MCSPTDTKGWLGHLVDSITNDPPAEEFALEAPSRYAAGGATITDIKIVIDAQLAQRTDTPEIVMVYMGANDTVDPYYSGLSEAGWKADYQYVIDALHTKWPSAKIYLGKSWRLGYASRFAVINAWIDDLIAANSSFCYLGLDGQPILSGHAELYDGVHPNHDGCVALAAGWKPLLDY